MDKKGKFTEAKEVAQDLAGATLEVGTSMVLENLPELGVEVAGIIGNEAVGTTIQTLAGGLLGAVAPAALGVKLSFQQKRFERNMIKMVNSVKAKQDLIAQRLDLLEDDVRQKFIDGPYRDVLLDNIVSENQEQKIQDTSQHFHYCNVNGSLSQPPPGDIDKIISKTSPHPACGACLGLLK